MEEQTLKVENSSGQQPYIPDEEAQNIQNTRGSETFGVQTKQQNQMSAQEQQELMNFLRTEAAGPTYNKETVMESGVDAGLLSAFIAGAVFAGILVYFYYRIFSNILRKTT